MICQTASDRGDVLSLLYVQPPACSVVSFADSSSSPQPLNSGGAPWFSQRTFSPILISWMILLILLDLKIIYTLTTAQFMCPTWVSLFNYNISNNIPVFSTSNLMCPKSIDSTVNPHPPNKQNKNNMTNNFHSFQLMASLLPKP